MRKLGMLFAFVLVLSMVLGTMPALATSENYFPENLFSSADACGQYFHNADEAGTVYEEVDGEYIMTMPIHAAFNYLYTKEAIPYESFTVSFDFYLIISPDSHFHEADLLFGMSGEAKPFHQISVVAQNGSLFIKHYTLEDVWSEYEGDSYFYDIYEEECWQTFKAEFSSEGVCLYLNGDSLGFLTESEECIGDNGYIGLRAGSAGGWKIKNLKIAEGFEDDMESEPTEAVTEQPGEEPTEAVTEQPGEEPTEAPSDDSTETITPESTVVETPKPTQPVANDGGFPWWIVGVIGGIVVVAGAVVWFVLKKRK